MDRKALVCLASIFLASCGEKAQIVVGSKNFTEQVLLGEILAQHLERRLGLTVDRKLNLGGTLLAHEALRSGSIDLYPEYTGTALTAILKKPPSTDRETVLNTVRAQYSQQWQLTWLDPLGFNNTFAMIVSNQTAQGSNLRALSQAAQSGKAWKLGVGYEFLKRPDGLDGLLRTYGLKINGSPITMDLGLLYAALKSNKVDLIAANSTDGLISALPVTVLEDDKKYFPPYECAVVVRDATLARMPELRASLSQLSGKLTEQTMRKLNFRVDGERRPVRMVAEEFLKSIN